MLCATVRLASQSFCHVSTRSARHAWSTSREMLSARLVPNACRSRRQSVCSRCPLITCRPLIRTCKPAPIVVISAKSAQINEKRRLGALIAITRSATYTKDLTESADRPRLTRYKTFRVRLPLARQRSVVARSGLDALSTRPSFSLYFARRAGQRCASDAARPAPTAEAGTTSAAPTPSARTCAES